MSEPIALIVRDLDKRAAALSLSASAVLTTLAEHANVDDAACPGLDRIQRSANLSHGAVVKGLAELETKGLVRRGNVGESERLRGRFPSRATLYRLAREAILRLPRLESIGHGMAECAESIGHQVADRDRQSATARGSIGHGVESIGHGDASTPYLKTRVEDEREDRRRAPPPPPERTRGVFPREGDRVADEHGTEGTLGIEDAWRIADEVATRFGRPRSQRDEKPMRELVAKCEEIVQGSGGSAESVLEAWLVAHYRRYDEGLARRRWPIGFVKQIAPPRLRKRPRLGPSEPTLPEAPLGPTDAQKAMLASLPESSVYKSLASLPQPRRADELLVRDTSTPEHSSAKATGGSR